MGNIQMYIIIGLTVLAFVGLLIVLGVGISKGFESLLDDDEDEV